MWCTTECWDCEDKKCEHYISKSELYFENKRLVDQLQQKENIIKELNDKIDDDKMIIEGNWGCIDNLKKDYNLQKNIIKEVREYIEKNWISQKDADNYRFDDEELDIEISDIAVLFDILDKENKEVN